MGVHLGMTHDRCFCFLDVDLAILPADQDKFAAAREKFRRPAFVSLNVGIWMTDNAVKRLTKLSQRKRVCGRSV